jgi:signal transduction histidine kinase
MRFVLLLFFSATTFAQTTNDDEIYVDRSEFEERAQQDGMLDRHKELLERLNAARSRVSLLGSGSAQLDRTLRILETDLEAGDLTDGQREYVQELISRLESEYMEFNQELRAAELDLRRQERLWENANDEAVALIDQIREEKRGAAASEL